MNFQIVFDNSGDSLPFCAINPEVLEYYVSQLDGRGLNKFHDRTSMAGKNIAQKITTLHNSIVEVNQWAAELMDKKINECDTVDYLNQYNLNKIHDEYVWTKRNLKYDIDQKRKNHSFKGYAETLHNMYPDDVRFPKITDVLAKLGKSDLYTSVNLNLHQVERSFNLLRFGLRDTSWVEFKNPFSSNILTNNICNIRLGFHHVGRTLHDKYCNFDLKLEFGDENSFDELVDIVEISLVPPQTIPLSQEYTNWCQLHHKVPSGKYLNIGNIPDLEEKLHNYRIVVFRNLLVNNSFTIHIN